jgi:DHA1 family inner membrane transport protein
LLGVPAGTWLAQTFGWRVVFWLIAAIGVTIMALPAVDALRFPIS